MFFSKRLTESQEKYSSTMRELLAIVKSIKYFKHHLIHTQFTLRTDHQSLIALKNTKNQNSIIFRWGIILSEYNYNIEYIKGEINLADALSRISINTVTSLSSDNRKIILDSMSRKDIIEDYHLSLAHGSSKNMLYNMKIKYEWPEMQIDIEDYTSRCKQCVR